MLAQSLTDDIEPARQRGIAESPVGSTSFRSDRPDEGFFWIDQLRLGLGQCRSNCAYRLTRALHGFPLGANAMADSFLGVLWHQRLQLSFGPLMIQKCLPCAAEQVSKFRPGIGSTPAQYVGGSGQK